MPVRVPSGRRSYGPVCGVPVRPKAPRWAAAVTTPPSWPGNALVPGRRALALPPLRRHPADPRRPPRRRGGRKERTPHSRSFLSWRGSAPLCSLHPTVSYPESHGDVSPTRPILRAHRRRASEPRRRLGGGCGPPALVLAQRRGVRAERRPGRGRPAVSRMVPGRDALGDRSVVVHAHPRRHELGRRIEERDPGQVRRFATRGLSGGRTAAGGGPGGREETGRRPSRPRLLCLAWPVGFGYETPTLKAAPCFTGAPSVL